MAKKTIIFDDYEKSNKKSAKIGKGISSKMVAIIVAAVLVVAIAVTAIVSVIKEQNSYIATVNGIKISVTDFDAELKAVVQSYLDKAVQEQKLDTEDEVEVEKFLSSKNEAGVSMRLAAKQEAFQNAIEYAVQLLVAEEKGIVLTQQDKSNLIKEAEANAEYYANYYNQSYQTNQYTAESIVEEMYGASYTEYKQKYMESYILNKLTVMMKAQMTVTDDQIKAWYDKAPETYDLYMVDSIYVSYQKTGDDKKTVMLEGDELTKKQTAVEKIATELTAENFKGYAKDNADATVASTPLKMTDGKVSLTNASANMEEVNKWLNETGLKDATKWTKIEVKGTGDFKEKVVGVYFVKFDQKVDIHTEDNSDATDMRKTIKEEIMTDNYEKMVEEWAKDTKYEVSYNGDIYKNYTVEGQKAE